MREVWELIIKLIKLLGSSYVAKERIVLKSSKQSFSEKKATQ